MSKLVSVIETAHKAIKNKQLNAINFRDLLNSIEETKDLRDIVEKELRKGNSQDIVLGILSNIPEFEFNLDDIHADDKKGFYPFIKGLLIVESYFKKFIEKEKLQNARDYFSDAARFSPRLSFLTTLYTILITIELQGVDKIYEENWGLKEVYYLREKGVDGISDFLDAIKLVSIILVTSFAIQCKSVQVDGTIPVVSASEHAEFSENDIKGEKKKEKSVEKRIRDDAPAVDEALKKYTFPPLDGKKAEIYQFNDRTSVHIYFTKEKICEGTVDNKGIVIFKYRFE